MKLLKPLAITLFTTTALFSQTTMCFKENHNSMTTIETTKLSGGECNDTYTIKDMKKDNWKVDDIKITTTNQGKYNFIYILKKASVNSNISMLNSNLSQEELENSILKRMEKKKEIEKKEKKIQEDLQAKIDGKRIYINKCQSCHGEKGEKSAYNVTTPLKDMSEEDIGFAINRYTNDDEYGNGYQVIMNSIAANTTSNDINKIYNYLKSLNK